MAKDVLAIDFDGKFIKLLTGNRNLVKYTDIIEVDEADLINGEIANFEAVTSVLGIYLKEKRIREKDLLISIHEPDTVIRHMQVPLMEDKAIREAIQYETNQYLPQNGANHYIDYEIVEKIETDDKKVYNLLVVAVSKAKIDKYVELSKKLKLNLKTIDIASNCIARTFRGVSTANKDMPNIGVID